MNKSSYCTPFINIAEKVEVVNDNKNDLKIYFRGYSSAEIGYIFE